MRYKTHIAGNKAGIEHLVLFKINFDKIIYIALTILMSYSENQ